MRTNQSKLSQPSCFLNHTENTPIPPKEKKRNTPHEPKQPCESNYPNRINTFNYLE
ncbi:hypothetical protein Hanom_Chr10g00927171 [Helianthus anomalus]